MRDSCESMNCDGVCVCVGEGTGDIPRVVFVTVVQLLKTV